jgi:hypothetical protein
MAAMRYEYFRANPGLMIDILGKRFERSSSDGAFYLWAEVPKGMTDD